MNPKSPYTPNIEGIDIEDKNIKYVLLETGTYKINDEIINVKGSYHDRKEVGVKDFTDIRIIEQNTIIDYYVCDDEIMKVENYQNKKQKLETKRQYNDYEESYIWNSLEDEFTYKKFIQMWQPIKRTIQTISEPIEIEIKKIKVESGNKFITSRFLNGIDKDLTLFNYDKPSALKYIVSKCFIELGMIYKDKINYASTINNKIWGNSEHSCIRYVTAFGTYIFGDGWDVKHSPKGTLEELLKQYENDRKIIRGIIISKYNQHFGKIDVNEFDFDGLLSKLKSALNYIAKVDPKQKTIQDYKSGLNKIKEAIIMIESSYEVKNEKLTDL